mgnify:CR=1 FL=1
MINNIFNSSITYAPSTKDIKKDANKDVKQSSKNEEAKKSENTSDKYESSLSKYEQRKQISYMVSQAEHQTRNFERLVSSIFSRQSNKVGLSKMAYDGNLKNFYKNLTVDAKTIAKAKEDISEDGYYGVNQTSDRILSFAKSIACDDPKKMEEMRNAVEKGFKQAEKMWGDKLPDISQKTYDKVMEIFDKWQGKDTLEK